MSGILVATTRTLAGLRDVNDAAQADGLGLTWDAATSKHVYVALATVAEVNTLLDGRDFKPAARVATTAAGTLATSFENGDTIDGVVLATGDRILIKDQAAATENGIYTVEATGAPTRATDLDTGDSAANSFVSIEEGTANESTAWICPENVGSDVVGTDTITFTNYAGLHVHDTGDITSGTLAHERGGLEFDVSAVAIGDVIAGTGTGTLALVAASGSSDGDVLTIQADGSVAFETPAAAGLTTADIDTLAELTAIITDATLAVLGGNVFTGVHDFGGADSLEIPNSATPTVDAAGEIALDTTVTDYTGLLTYHDGGEALFVVALPTANLSTTDHEVVAYDAVENEFHMIGAVAPYVEDTVAATAAGDVVYQTGTDGEWTNLPIGSPNDQLEVRSGLPSWQPRLDACLARVVATSDVDVDAGRWDISTAASDSVFESVTGEEGTPGGLAFSADGTKAYVVGKTNRTIYQYTLSTGWDLSTASYASKSLSVSSQEGTPEGVELSADGTKAYVVGATDTIYQYTLSTAWDISTGSYASKSLSVSSQESQTYDLSFSADGTKAYVVGWNNDTIYQYTLSTAWDISTGSYASKSLSVSSEETFPVGMTLSADGTKAYVVGVANDTIYQYTLSTAWDLSTGSYASKSKNVNSVDLNPQAFRFKPDGSKLYILGRAVGRIYQLSVGSTPADPSPVDGVTLADGNRVLLSGQTAGSQNGVYDAVTATDPATWTRVDDMAADGSASGRLVAVAAGTTNSTSLWVCDTAAGSDVVGTDDLTFTKYT